MPDYHSKKDIEKSLDFASRFLLLSKKVSDSNWGAVFCDRNILVYGEQMPQSEIKKGNMSDLSFSDYPM